MASHDLVPHTGGGLSPWSPGRKAGKEIARIQAYGSAVAARQNVKAEIIGDVTRTAIAEFGDIAIAAEILAQRSPGFTPEAVLLARRGANALGRVIDETERLW